jgi:riboflavin biosynthesis pyrimidine reductase
VLVGAGTAMKERYGPIVRELPTRRLREERGLSEQPLACVVSGGLSLETTIPLLADAQTHVVVLTASQGTLAGARAQVDYLRPTRGGELDLAGALALLRERFGVQLLLCEGGPHLARSLLAGGLLDELFLSLSPLLAGGEASGGGALRILAGAPLEPPVGAQLLDALRHDSGVFLRYAVGAGARTV